jgi:hypothetical protein
MCGFVPNPGVLVEADYKSVAVSDGIRHILFADRTITGQFLGGIQVTAEDVKPAARIIIIRVSVIVRNIIPEISQFVVAATDINADISIVNRLHNLYPSS